MSHDSIRGCVRRLVGLTVGSALFLSLTELIILSGTIILQGCVICPKFQHGIIF